MRADIQAGVKVTESAAVTPRRGFVHVRALRSRPRSQVRVWRLCMNAKATREPFYDPYDELSDEEFEREILQALDQSSTKISLRLPNELLDRTKRAALRRG